MSPLLLLILSLLPAAEYRLPFDGRWFVMHGGDTLNVNHHMSLRPQWFGVDFAKVGGESGRELARGGAAAIEDFYSWDQPVLSPCAGEVIAVVDGLPDNPLGVKDAENPAGNHVVVKAGEDRYVFLAHFRMGSITVKVGQRIAPGEVLGQCGNSGHSDFPHIHMHIQNSPQFNTGQGQNPLFSDMDVELSGKRFENVTWPVIRGLFVEPHRK